MFSTIYAPVVDRCFPGDVDADLTRPGAGESWRAFTRRFAACWVRAANARHGIVITMIHGRSYDVTDFVDEHPGDPQLLIAAAGRDATGAFDYVGHSSSAHRVLAQYAVPALDACAAVAIEAEQWRRRRLRGGRGRGEDDDEEEKEEEQQAKTTWPRWGRVQSSVSSMARGLWHSLTLMNEGSSMRRGTAAQLLDEVDQRVTEEAAAVVDDVERRYVAAVM